MIFEEVHILTKTGDVRAGLRREKSKVRTALRYLANESCSSMKTTSVFLSLPYVSLHRLPMVACNSEGTVHPDLIFLGVCVFAWSVNWRSTVRTASCLITRRSVGSATPCGSHKRHICINVAGKGVSMRALAAAQQTSFACSSHIFCGVTLLETVHPCFLGAGCTKNAWMNCAIFALVKPTNTNLLLNEQCLERCSTGSHRSDQDR